jgi:hypothetical protein
MTSYPNPLSFPSERTPKQRWLLFFAIAAAMVVASPAVADPLEVALLERVSSSSLNTDSMEYVRTGQIIKLRRQQTIVLTYMDSCVREIITGGTVIIGIDRSEVQSGDVESMRVPCGVGKLVLTGAQNAIAGRTFRGGISAAR